jgi:phosphate transport system permease protein
VYSFTSDGLLRFRPTVAGLPERDFPIPDLKGASVVASSRGLLDGTVAAALSDGRVSLAHIRLEPIFKGNTLEDVSIAVTPRATVQLDASGRTPRQISHVEQDGGFFVAGVVGNDEVAYWHKDAEGAEHRAILRTKGQTITAARVGRNGNVILATDRGHVFHWEGGAEPLLTDNSTVSDKKITALEWVLGGNSYVAGTEDGRVSSWFRAPVGANEEYGMVRAHEFEPQQSAIIAIAMSPRDRSFATSAADGSIVLRHQTSERTLGKVSAGAAAAQVSISPRSDGLLALTDKGIERFQVRNPHPEVSWTTLFGKVWYEGYATSQYVWQSTGATDDFEAKFSLVPLIFGTIKGTFYALLFAIPLAVTAALYTSQFVNPTLRNRIKPAVEIMAALPSVVIGFLAGLYLATVVERNLAGVFVMMVLMPVFGVSGVLIWRLLPKTMSRRLPAGSEIAVIIPLLVLAGWVAFTVGPYVEVNLLGTDMREWLLDNFGVTYDQRNSLVVGLAMGFAVIPIIFTISEDAFSSVPSNLTAASLALGGSRWQTATRIVLPTASPGIFSAVMVGFGRAVGETMIVLMATGNTPLLDWSIFNGMRTLSANIAVEIPEAPNGGTLYRILFLAATLLFALTFIVNTIAEVVRQRLRERYKAI